MLMSNYLSLYTTIVHDSVHDPQFPIKIFQNLMEQYFSRVPCKCCLAPKLVLLVGSMIDNESSTFLFNFWFYPNLI